MGFVDGSYSPNEEKSGFGAILIDHKRVRTPLYKSFSKKINSDFLELRNVAAELEGVKESINWALAYKKNKITIYFDYEGIGKWANGSWKANNELTRNYVNFVNEKKKRISIDFVKVPAHSGIVYNEEADTLAKRSLHEKGFKTYNDGSIYFVGFSAKDWEVLVEYINEENLKLTEGLTNKIIVNTQDMENRVRIDITDKHNRVSINCYSNRNSYVQGKQSVLFQKIISMAIELMSSDQIVIETLNRIHVLTLTQNEVEIKFEEMLPDYDGERSGKHYNNLMTAVYNTMLVGYMPDYTSLITPIFRAYEYYLHRILGDKMELSTSNVKGNNNFSYFNKDDSGKYRCTSNAINKLSDKQKSFLEELYNAYNGVRHPYSHWSAEDYDTAVITSIDVAREHLFKGLTLINNYYKLF